MVRRHGCAAYAPLVVAGPAPADAVRAPVSGGSR
ncbi:hypothetical protein GA0115247_11951 [Streptomyces sp. PalvLS-984]|nr:hypothetical protein GA0115247_11951 [Streptomyces sp. PalvLS-984]